ncbi:FkbM family methyltransferase [Phenylobacterium sp.]|uniref:FkbM family methyltransferase n=1 Tax=Phenylobacterium sp. TaxID=1871053 RepID=UPI002CF92FFB|nr:FkbM family methyltransferase [Phenylobacterium sp.]HVI33734.1 FkbM family methyltransferase [Phenylobacterium sp.]
MISRAHKLAAIAIRPQLWPALWLRVAPTVEHEASLSRFAFGTVIDVGANKGQFAAFAAATWPQARLECFEPLPAPRARLQQVLRTFAAERSTVHDLACSRESGLALMHVASREDSSSLLPLGDRQREMFGMDEAGQLSVRTERLDQVVSGELARPALLKIDVQGFEYEVLEGATALLPNIDVVYVEASFVELYAGQKLADEIERFLWGHGFALKGRFNTHFDTDGSAIQADLLFVGAEPR